MACFVSQFVVGESCFHPCAPDLTGYDVHALMTFVYLLSVVQSLFSHRYYSDVRWLAYEKAIRRRIPHLRRCLVVGSACSQHLLNDAANSLALRPVCDSVDPHCHRPL